MGDVTRNIASQKNNGKMETVTVSSNKEDDSKGHWLNEKKKKIGKVFFRPPVKFDKMF